MIATVLSLFMSVICSESILLRSWREGVTKTHNYAQQLSMLCHVNILDCAAMNYNDMHTAEVYIVAFSIHDDEVPFSYLTLQRLHDITKPEMFTFWKAPTMYDIISLRNEIAALQHTYNRVESLRDRRDRYDSLMAEHLEALRYINNTLHRMCDQNFTFPYIDPSPASALVMDYTSRSQLLARRSALCRHHNTNTSRYVIYQTDYEPSSGDMLYVLESRTTDVYDGEDEVLLARDIVASPPNTTRNILTMNGGIMSSISLRCQENSGISECIVDHSCSSFYIYNMIALSAGMSLSPIDTFDVSESPHMLAVGLGGGRLHTYAINHHPALHVDTVEISANMLQAAQNYFGFNACDVISAYSPDALSEFFQRSFVSAACRSRVILADGSTFLAEAAAQQKLYDFVFVDMFDTRVVEYTGDSGVGDGNIVTPELLRNVARLVHPSKGIALIYLLDDAEYSNHVAAVCHLFKRVIHVAVSGNSHILAASHWEELGVAPDKQYREGEANIDVFYLADRVEQYAISHNYDSRLVHEYKYVFKELQ